jgi:cytidylate kinase
VEKVVIVSGFAGSGKSTLAKRLAGHFGLKCVHASDLLKQLMEKKAAEIDTGATTEGKGWWESEEAREYMEKRSKDSSMDRELDRMLLKLIDSGNVVMDSWTMPWLSKKGFRIWLEVSPEARAERVSKRDGLDYESVHERIMSRDTKTAEIYRKTYGFDFGKDLSPFNIVIDAGMAADEVFEEAKAALEKYFNA